MGIEGLNALVTGTAKGIGRSVAEALAAGGANLALCDILESGLNDTVEGIKARYPVKVVQKKVDVSQPDEIAGFTRWSEESLGSVDILVNNAGIYILKLIDEISAEEWDKVMSVNLRSVFLFTKAALPGMRRRKFGRVINMASAAGIAGGTVCASHYAASKGGILAFTRHMAKQEGLNGITINAVAPALIAADMMLNLAPPDLDKAINATVVKRLGKVEEVADAVVFLADRKAAFITGETLQVNGGSLTV